MKKTFVLMFALVCFVILAACAGPRLSDSPLIAASAPGELGPPVGEVPSLKTAFAIVAAGAVGGIISFLFERFKWFQSLTGEARFWIVFGLSVGLPLLARIALQYVPDDVWLFLEPYWQSLALGFLAFIASQVAHTVNKRLEDSQSPIRRIGR